MRRFSTAVAAVPPCALPGGGIPGSATGTDPDGNPIHGTVVAKRPLPGWVPGMLSNTFMTSASGTTTERVGSREVAPQQEGDQWTGNMYRNTVLVSVEGASREGAVEACETFHSGTIDASLVPDQ